MKCEEFWQEFLRVSGKDGTLQFLESFHFELHKSAANELLELVLSGVKCATASSLYSFSEENTRVPQAGDYSIVTDWDNRPYCVIETTTVQVLPFRDITYEICKREGEDDTLESWQKNHRHFFTEEGKILGYEFSEDMPVVFEDFRVVYRV